MSRRRTAVSVVVIALIGAGIALVVGALGGGGGSPVHVEPEVTFALPSTRSGCAGSTALPGGAARLPLTVSVVAGQVAESLNVCIDGEGPYQFVLDTGASESTIDAGLAKRLHLPSAGSPTEYAGVGCTGSARPVTVASWSMGGVPLMAQTLTAATLPQIGGRGEPMGLLGSDVLGRYGAIRIDFADHSLTVPGPEGAPLDGGADVVGPVGSPPSAILTGGRGTTIPATVSQGTGSVSVNVDVRFGHGTRRSFVVDTGSSQSVVATRVVQTQHLAPTNLAQRQATVCSTITVPLVHSGPWSVQGLALYQQLVGATDFGSIADGGTQGLLGSDQLRRYGWVVLDYAGGRIVLG